MRTNSARSRRATKALTASTREAHRQYRIYGSHKAAQNDKRELKPDSPLQSSGQSGRFPYVRSALHITCGASACGDGVRLAQ